MTAATFTETSGSTAARSNSTPAYVVRLAREGLLEHITASDGTRLFRPDAADEVRRIKAERLANRARRKAETAAPAA